MNIAYVRVSTIDQNEGRQLECLKKYHIEKWFIEKVSGKNMDRPKLKEMFDFAREGDTIYVHDFSRLARSTQDLLNIVEQLNKRKINLVSNKEQIDTTTSTGQLMLTMIAAINQFERQNLLERQREGIFIAKQNGKYKGRKKVEINQDLWDELYNEFLNKEINKNQFAEKLNVSRPTLNKLLKK